MAQTGFSGPFPSLACDRLLGAVIVIGATAYTVRRNV
jgi:hypothetical protein